MVATIIICCIVGICAICAVIFIIKNKIKNRGKCSGCGGHCYGCPLSSRPSHGDESSGERPDGDRRNKDSE